MNKDPVFAGRVQAYLDGILSDSDRSELFAEIRRSPEAARMFADQVRLDASLDRMLRRPSPVELFARDRVSDVVQISMDPELLFPASPWCPSRARLVLDHVWGPVTAILLHAALLLFILRWTLPTPGEEWFSPLTSVVRWHTPLDSVPEPESADREWMLSIVGYLQPHSASAPLEPPRLTVQLGGADPSSSNASARSPVPGIFSSRSLTQRTAGQARLAPDWGERADRAVQSGLRWLETRQLPNGSWAEYPEDTVRLAALSAAAGLARDPNPADPTGQMVLRALTYIQMRQLADGRFDPDPGTHAAALLALTELRAMWGFSGNTAALERGMEALIQNVESDYISKSRDAAGAAAAVAWQAQALALLIHLHPDREDLRGSAAKLVAKLKTLHDPASGHFSIPGTRSASERTRLMASAVSALHMLNEGRSIESRRARARLLRQNPSDFAAELAVLSPEHLFFLFDALGRNPQADSTAWLSAAAERVLSLQAADGGWTDGGYSPDARMTSAAIIALSAPFRFSSDLLARSTPGGAGLPRWARFFTAPARWGLGAMILPPPVKIR